MKKYYMIAILAVWVIVLVASEIILSGTGKLTYLGPLYFICMIASLAIVGKAFDKGK